MGCLATIFTSILCMAGSFLAKEGTVAKTEMHHQNFKLGKEVVEEVRSKYENGKYNHFLIDLDKSYRKADLKPLVTMRQKEIPLEFQKDWESKFLSLQNQKNHELLEVLSEKDHSLFAEKIRSITSNPSNLEQEKAISRLNSLIAKAPKTGANEDENTLIDIDVEYEYKLFSVDMPHKDLSEEQMHHQRLALRMEKMDRMLQVSKSFKDLSLKEAVELAAKNLDARLARNLDGADLHTIVKKAKPQNENHEAIYSIITSYQGKFADLMKELSQANR